ncbi:uncharacterized protein si:ch211-113e8.11 [Brienomyrus brachyistius]|uniref:uncharacterized protein si:ch211-113e8.11 n=1 Tax=Brienomyrus brachyistius TaxID=42636 RepID=UPI0020B2E46C|nr:uncharacterized protein si:ch211-113e8.11 [Brienomyrus brachyistius]
MSAKSIPLVGYGSSSDSDSDAGEQGQHETDGRNESGTEVKSQNLLLESGFGSSSSSDSEENPNVQTGLEVPVEPETSAPASATQQPGGRLPPPPPSVLSGSSVFANPFKEQAEERLSFLQKHVPLTTQARPSHIGGRSMCVAYRRDGRCRFGSSCKFAHDSDLQIPMGGHQSNLSSPAQQSVAEEPEGDSKEVLEEGAKRKRKVGLSDGLTPPKRALKQYKAQRKKEGLSPLS